MPDLNGMHAPDGKYTFNEFLINDVTTGGIVLMDFQMKSNPATQMHSNWECDNWVWLRAGCPPWKGGDPRGVLGRATLPIGIRMYQQDWRSWALMQEGGNWKVNVDGCKRWAQITVEQLTSVRGGKFNPGVTLNMLADEYVAVWPWNEPDIEPIYQPYMCEEWWYDLIGHSWLVWAEEVRRLMGKDLKAKLTNAPLAGGHDIPGWCPDEEYQQDAMNQMLRSCDVINGHVYGHLNQGMQYGSFGAERYWNGSLRLWRPFEYKNQTENWWDRVDPGGLFVQYHDKPKIISECGFFYHEKKEWTDTVWPHFLEFYRVAEADGDVCFVAPFIANSNSYHEGNRIFPNEALREKFRAMPRFTGRAWPLTTDVPPEPDIPPDPDVPDPEPEEEVFDPNPLDKSVYPFGEIWKLAANGATRNGIKIPQMTFVSDEITLNGPTGGNIVWARAKGVDGSDWMLTWSPGDAEAKAVPLV